VVEFAWKAHSSRTGRLNRPEVGNTSDGTMPERRTTGAVARLAMSLLMLTITIGCASSQAATGNTVTFYIFNEPGGSFQRAADSCTQAAQGRYRIQLALLPSNADRSEEHTSELQSRGHLVC